MSAAWFDWLLNQPGGRSRGCRPLGNIHLIIVFVGVAGRAGRRDASGVGRIRFKGRRHGRRCAGAVSKNESAWRQPRRSRRPARGHRRTDRNRSTKPCPDCHRFDDGRFDLGAVYRRSVAARSAVRAMIIILAMGSGLFAPRFGVGYYGAGASGASIPPRGSG